MCRIEGQPPAFCVNDIKAMLWEDDDTVQNLYRLGYVHISVVGTRAGFRVYW